jgi:hypothetical protein
MTVANQSISRAASELRSWGAVAIVGAGASLMAGFPLTAQLQALLWHALDADEQARDTLATAYGRTTASAKDLIGDDPVLTRAALEAVATSRTARRAYQ